MATQRCWNCEILFSHRFSDLKRVYRRGFQVRCPLCDTINEAGAGLTDLELQRAESRGEKVFSVRKAGG